MKRISFLSFAAVSMMICACSTDIDPDVLGSLFLGDGEVKVIDYEAVDLGLSVKWADCNLGGLKDWQDCKFFAWGEISEKTTYTWSNYLYFNPAKSSMLKYNSADGLNFLEAEDDPVIAAMGSGWRLPTRDEMEELFDYCEWTVSTRGGNKIITATSKKNGASIVFPLTGYKEGDSLKGVGVQGYIWSSERVEESPSQAWVLGFNMKDNEIVLERRDRGLGFCVRGVRR